MSQTNYENRIVAFIDILGFKQIVNDSENNPSKIEVLYEVLNFLKSKEVPHAWETNLVSIEEDAQKKGLHKFQIGSETSCSCFSDSLIVSVKISTNVNEAVSTLLANLLFIGYKLFSEGILIRGGITIGNLIHNNNGIVMGPALIEAYELESNLAKYPRIILSNELIKCLNYPLLSKFDRYPYHQYLIRFDDGCVGFHQFVYLEVIQSWDAIEKSDLGGMLTCVRQKILSGLDNSFTNVNVYEKYQWLKKQYNALNIYQEDVYEEIVDIAVNSVTHNIHYTNKNPPGITIED